jgi:hypothetical protein
MPGYFCFFGAVFLNKLMTNIPNPKKSNPTFSMNLLESYSHPKAKGRRKLVFLFSLSLNYIVFF